MRSGSGGKLREMYASMFTYHRLLPDVVGKQNPWAFFKMLDALDAETNADIDGNEYLEMFYGR